jgi:hypothetical protein
MNGILDISKLKLNVVPNATRPSNETRAELFTNNKMGKLSLNKSATSLMGVETGDFVKIITNSEAKDIDDAFYVVVSNDETGCKLSNRGEKTEGVGLSQDFSCAGVWSIMVQKNPKAIQLGEDALFKLGILTEVTTTRRLDGTKCYSKLLKERVSFKVSVVTDENDEPLKNVEIGNEVYSRLYSLTEMKTSINDYFEEALQDDDENTVSRSQKSIFDLK